ncbi:hypothetical protein DXG01_014433 [Tephrocybe rancida]|nr:hypothetical protein DXG01_014433 [Tephrocybe rancida]
MSSSDLQTNYIDPCPQPSENSAALWLESAEGTSYTECYCALCDKYFRSLKRREKHVARSPHHPRCEPCGRRFLNGNTLRVHELYSRDHRYAVDEDCSGDEIESSPYDDQSWETYDEFDFEDLDGAGDEVPECIAHLVKRDDEEEEQEEENESGPPATEFACPICDLSPNTVCSTLCGHLFCAPCIKLAYDIQGSCPICDEEGNVNQLRKMYISV